MTNVTDLHIIIVGNSNMGRVMATYCTEMGIPFTRTGEYPPYDALKTGPTTVAFHFGSGRELPNLIAFGEATKIPIINASTRGVTIPETCKTLFIHAPNLSLPMIRLMSELPGFLSRVGGSTMDIEIAESHRPEKTDLSGTARFVADVMKVPHEKIRKIRDTFEQILLGVPRRFLEWHAYHWFTLSDEDGVEIEVRTRIPDRTTYASGGITLAFSIIQAIEKANASGSTMLSEKVERQGVYSFKDIIRLLV